MLEKPDIADEKIITCLGENYAIDVTKLEFLPLGYDITASVYRVETEVETYFLKVKLGKIQKASLTIPFILNGIGISEVVAPIQNQQRHTTTELDNFKLILYPFVAGQTGMEIGLSDAQWREFGKSLKRVHSTDLPDGIRKCLLHKETFIPPYAKTVRKLDAHIAANTLSNPHEKALAEFWMEKRAEILKILNRTEELGHMLQAQAIDFVLCHSDIHTANILVDADDKLHIVDWDGVQFAPKERDLMFVTEKSERENQLFFEGYGKTAINQTAIAYYRYEWVVQEFGDFGEQVLFMDTIGDETKANAVREFKQLFAIGDVVQAAYEADLYLSS